MPGVADGRGRDLRPWIDLLNALGSLLLAVALVLYAAWVEAHGQTIGQWAGVLMGAVARHFFGEAGKGRR